MYPCQEDDYAKFFPANENAKDRLNKMQNEDGRNLFCIDWSDESLELYGTEASGNYGLIEISVVPCNVRLSLESIGGVEDRIDPDCRWDFEE